MKKRIFSLRSLRAVTLIEIIIVIVILGILFVMGARFFQLSYNLYDQQKQIINDNWQGQLAAQMIKRDIELIRSTADITAATAATLTFTTIYGDTVTYQQNGSQLRRNNQRLVEDLQSLTFMYYNGSGTQLTSPINVSNIRYIVCTIVTGANVTFTFTSGAALWNVF